MTYLNKYSVVFVPKMNCSSYLFLTRPKLLNLTGLLKLSYDPNISDDHKCSRFCLRFSLWSGWEFVVSVCALKTENTSQSERGSSTRHALLLLCQSPLLTNWILLNVTSNTFGFMSLSKLWTKRENRLNCKDLVIIKGNFSESRCFYVVTFGHFGCVEFLLSAIAPVCMSEPL